MSLDNPQPTDFRAGDRVRVLKGSTTASGFDEQIGVVLEPEPKYKFRVGVQFCVDRELREIYFHPSELEIVREDKN